MTITAGQTIPADLYRSRIDRLAGRAEDAGFGAVLIAVGPDLEYLTGYRAMPLERLTMLVLGGGRVTLLAPRLERAAAEAGTVPEVPIRTWEETESPHRLIGDLVPVGEATRVAVSEQLWALHLLRIQEALPAATFEIVTPLLREIRMRKDPPEVELLRRAARAADRVVDRIAAGRLVGRTEADVAREVRDRLVAEGHDSGDFAIVASGPNSASPHHEASDRVIQAGEPIVLDIGGRLGGYASDTTRTVWVTGGDPARGPDPEFRRLFDVLQSAQDEATGAVRPGIPCERIDAVARGIIEAGGFGPNFIHRTGHGIGLETHEEPYIVAGSTTPLEAGMAFSVEPGIYLEGRYGARIEDIVVCGPNGPIVLNETSRDLRVVDG
ncbi:MAG TPA: Xaa-Pro peptidase family protein [Candidatus Limnocylindrales bacterium]